MSADSKPPTPLVLVTMGVSGTGKSYFGRRLAAALNWKFIEGDDYHPPENVGKMTRGIPLTDADRLPWLNELNAVLKFSTQKEESVILACSALKASYRDILRKDVKGLRFVFLKGSHELISQRLAQRQEHFMSPELLASQFAALEAPEDALVVDISQSADKNVEWVRQELGI